MKDVRVRLKKDITEREFLYNTFGDEEYELGIFDIEKMKTMDLEGYFDEYEELEIFVPKHDYYVGFGYEKENSYIWDCKVID